MEAISPKDFEAVIFDMDGVLIDSEPKWKIAMEEVFRSVGCTLTKKDFQKTVGLRIDEVVDFWYEEVGWENASPREVEQHIMDRMVEIITEEGEPLPGVIETLHFLKDRGMKIGLATSSYTVLINATLSALEVTDYFDQVHSAENEEFGKPHPAVYLSTAKQLNADPTRCLVIEDSFNGIISAKAARMKVACIPEKTHHPDTRLNIADYMFEDMGQMLESLKAESPRQTENG